MSRAFGIVSSGGDKHGKHLAIQRLSFSSAQSTTFRVAKFIKAVFILYFIRVSNSAARVPRMVFY